ncbi:hypothetical protein BBP40_008496 [Aspergillus hancockii]|nr:hypothetical protein BBP40_008496 [Aspergillus hancockii]
MASMINNAPRFAAVPPTINPSSVTQAGIFTSAPYQCDHRNTSETMGRIDQPGDMQTRDILAENFPPYPPQPSLVDFIPSLDFLDDISSSEAGHAWPGTHQHAASDTELCNKRAAGKAVTQSRTSTPQGTENKLSKAKRKEGSPKKDAPNAGPKESRFSKYRDRNREAARRSREKQRELAESLESKAASLELKRDALLEEVEDLKCNVQELTQGVVALHRLARSPRTSVQPSPTTTSVCAFCGGLCAPYNY